MEFDVTVNLFSRGGVQFFLDHTASIWSQTVHRAMIWIGFAAFPFSLCWVFAIPDSAQHARIQRGGQGGPDPPGKSQKYRISLQY